MAEPVGKTSINGILSCWFDEPAELSSVATLDPPAASAPVVSIAPQPASLPNDGTAAATRFYDLMEAINERHVLPDLFVPCAEKAETPVVMAANPTPVEVPQQKVRKMSVLQLVSEICQSHDSPLYQWLQRNQLAAEFDYHTQTVEQRWSPDGTYCSVRRTANGYTHTIVLKDNNARITQRVTGPDGTVLLHISASGALIENKQPALMTA